MNSVKNEYRPLLKIFTLLLSDIFALSISFFLSFFIRRLLIRRMGGVVELKLLAPFFILLIILTILLFFINNLYPGDMKSGVVELKAILSSIFLAFLTLGLSIYFLRFDLQISRFVFVSTFLFSCLFLSISRLIIHNRLSLFSWWNQPVVLIGKQIDVIETFNKLNEARRFALKPVSVMITDQAQDSQIINSIPSLPNLPASHKMLKDSGVKLAVYIANQSEYNQVHREQIYELSLTFPNLIYLMSDSPLNTISMKPLDLAGRPAIYVNYDLLNPIYKVVKRIEDLAICLFGAIFFLPFLLLISLLIRMDTPGPIIYRQKRIGKDGNLFDILKFRTMVADADEKLDSILENDENLYLEYKEYHKLRNDPRITQVGKFLRKTGLDELPQIINVLRGEMSIIGPRAYLPSETDEMGKSIDLILRVEPGITGWWQVMGRQDVSFQHRLLMDEYYISNFSLWLDLYILLKTVWVVISGQGE